MDSSPKKPPPRVRNLRVFDGVAASGAMSTAADLLHLTQPAVTRSVQTLEAELGVKLIERRRAGSFLTADGIVFARRTRRFFQQLDAALATVTGGELRSAAVGRLARQIGDVHIRSLIAIGKAHSFRRAAAMLGVAEPTLHRPARDLERLVKTPLFQRLADSIGLSVAGAELARHFALAGIEIDAGIEELAAQRGASAMTIKLGVLPLAPKRALAIVTGKLLQTRPQAHVVIEEANYDELVDALRVGAIDAIFGALRTPPPFADLREESLFDDPYAIVCRKHHPLTRLHRVASPDLAAYGWIYPTAALPRRAVLDALIAAWHLPHRVQIETNSVGALIAALEASDHLSLLPREYIGSDERSRWLAALNLRVPHAQRQVGLTTRRDFLPTALQAEFMARLMERAAL
jgi:LysR family transcriptional regulator of gallate degradation